MPANHSSMDLLSNGLGPRTGANAEKLAATRSDNQQGDSFKTVIDRGQQASRPEPAKTRDASHQGDSKPVVQGEKTSEAKTAEHQQEQTPKPDNSHTPKDEVDIEGPLQPNLSTEAVFVAEGAKQLSLLPTANPVAESGNALPPRDNKQPPSQTVSPAVIPQIAAAIDADVSDEIERVVVKLPHFIGTEAGGSTAEPEKKAAAIVETVVRQQRSFDFETGVNLSDNSAPANEATVPEKASPITTGPAATPNKPQDKSLAVSGETITLTANEGEADFLRSDTGARIPEVKRQPVLSQQNTHYSVALGQREPLTVTTEQITLDKASGVTLFESNVDKATPASALVENSATVKLSSAPIDQQWLQQFQTVQMLSAPGKTNAVQLQLPLNIHNPQWFAAMADRVSWLASQAIQAAEIQLDPPELGPLQVRIAVNNEHASVNFVSHQATVRDMLDSQIMRLRELFENEGMNLVDVNVSDRQQQEREQSQQNGKGVGNNLFDNDFNNETPPIIPVNTIRNWIDYYV